MTTLTSQRLSLACIAGCCAALLAVPASASIIQIASNEDASEHGLGAFTGSIEYNASVFGTEGNLTITLTNTSEPSNGGYITGFLFNINSADSNASASLLSTTHSSFLEVSNESGNPFGIFDAGAALNGDFLGNGNPSAGIAVGATGEFSFLITASDAGSLTAMSFITGPNTHNFLTRFRGFEDEESDKVPGMVVPAPGTLCLLFGGILIGGRRRRP